MNNCLNILVLYSDKELLHLVDGFALPDEKVEKRRGQLRVGRTFIQHCEGRPIDAQVFHGHEYSQIFFIGSFSPVFKQHMMTTVRVSTPPKADTVQQGQINEADYRRGYQQGYNAAMEHMQSEMEVNLTRLARFRDNQLNDWRHSQAADRKIGPPEYPKSHHTAAGLTKFELAVEPVMRNFAGDQPNAETEPDYSEIILEDFYHTRTDTTYKRSDEGTWYYESGDDLKFVTGNLKVELESLYVQIKGRATRPSEENMMYTVNPSKDNWVRDKVVNSANRPQYRDIGIRVDRNGYLKIKD